MHCTLAHYNIIVYRKPVFLSEINHIDDHALETLRQSIISVKNYSPVRTVDDDNCLFRALSTAAYGSDTLHTEIRLRTGINLIKMREQLQDFINNSTNK